MAEKKINFAEARQKSEPMKRALRAFQDYDEVIEAAMRAESQLASTEEQVRQRQTEFEALAQKVAQGESRLQHLERNFVEREPLYRQREKVIEEGKAVEAVLADRKAELATVEEAIKAIREEGTKYKKMAKEI